MIEELKKYLIEFFDSSELNRLHKNYGGGKIFSDPLIGVASGDDLIYQKFKEVVGPEHFTPLEFWVLEGNQSIPASTLRIISIIFPFADRIRKESKNSIDLKRLKLPAEIYSVGRNYANEFKKETCRHIITFLENKGYKGIAGLLSKNFTIILKGTFYSNWSERHSAFAAGLGTFSLHEGLITEVGCNVRIGSVITDAPLKITPRKSDDPYANCLYYSKGTCKKCIEKCPAGAISEKGHDKNKCNSYRIKIGRKMNLRIGSILKPHYRFINGELRKQNPPVGCAFCQFGVPCMDKNPMASLKE
ncbi:MAG: epoxyqueuosine reductase [Promethearchaeota archaeon]|nr:MAG: epoxyqueuosine reductase [Candidatus Lokiarchaeota archaeon]